MIARLERFGRKIQWTSCMAEISSRTRLKTVIEDRCRFRQTRIRQVGYGITNRLPATNSFWLCHLHDSFGQLGSNHRAIFSANAMAVPIIFRNPL